MHLRMHNMLNVQADLQQQQKTTSDSLSVSKEQEFEATMSTGLENVRFPVFSSLVAATQLVDWIIVLDYLIPPLAQAPKPSSCCLQKLFLLDLYISLIQDNHSRIRIRAVETADSD